MVRKKRRRRRRKTCPIGVPTILFSFRGGVAVPRKVRKQWGVSVPVTIMGIGVR